MDNFLGKLRLAKLNPLELQSLKKTVFIEETNKKKLSNNYPKKKAQGLNNFLGEYNQTIISKALKKKEILLVFSMKQV